VADFICEYTDSMRQTTLPVFLHWSAREIAMSVLRPHRWLTTAPSEVRRTQQTLVEGRQTAVSVLPSPS
jgi:hypothetical protein